MDTMDEAVFFTFLNKIVADKGCRIVNIDLEKQIIDVDGPPTAVADCARAIEDFVG